jgi:hypothetical protein
MGLNSGSPPGSNVATSWKKAGLPLSRGIVQNSRRREENRIETKRESRLCSDQSRSG